MEKAVREAINQEIILRTNVINETDVKHTEELNPCGDETCPSASSDTDESYSNYSDEDELSSHSDDLTMNINNASNSKDTYNQTSRHRPSQAADCGGVSSRLVMEAQEPAAVVTLEPPDGGWGWAVVVGGILVLALTALLGPCFGVLFSRPLLEMGASSTTVAWIFNIRMLIRMFVSILIGPLSKEFGFRIIGICGGALVALSMFLCAFCTVPEYFYFTYALVGGIGGGLAMSIPFIIVPNYFKKHLGKANSVMILGISLGQIVGPTFIRYLQDEFTFKGATIILSAIFLHCIPGAMLFHPVKWYMKPVRQIASPLLTVPKNDTMIKVKKYHTTQKINKRRSTIVSECSVFESIQDIKSSSISDIFEDPADTATKEEKSKGLCDKIYNIFKASLYSLKVLSSMRALIICIGGACVFNGFFNFFVIIPFALQSQGYELQSAAYCISTSAFCNTCTRFVLIFIADKDWFNTRLCYMIGCAIMVLMTTAFPLMPSLEWMIAVMGLWGIGLSLNITFHNVLMVQYMGLDQLASVYGASNFITGIGFICIGPFVGFIRDLTGSYEMAIHILAGVLAVCLLLWLFMPLAQKYDNSRSSITQSSREP